MINLLMSVKMSLWTLVVFLLAFVSRGNADECPKPEPEGNVVLTTDAILKNSFPDGSEVTLKCAVGYVKDQGSDTIRCISDRWSQQELTCKKKDCGHPRSSPNVQYEIPSGTLFGARIKVVCDHGYRLQGSSYRQCLATGWSGRSLCVLITCGKPPEIPHAVIVNHLNKESLTFKDVIEYKCEDKYTLVGNTSVVCQESGDYSSLPQCIGITCGKPPEIPHAVIVNHLNKEILEFKDVIEYKCEDKYTLEGTSVVCQENGNYSSLPQCIEKDCGHPRSSPNMQYHIPNGTLFGAHIIPVCDRGYRLQGSSYRQCLATGWSGNSECLWITCGKPPEIPHAVIVNHLNKESLTFKDVIEYKCEDKYTLVGNASVVCQENGNYSSLPQCIEKDCGHPRSSPNVQYEIPSGTLFGARIKAVCDHGYRLQGSSYRQCLATGWSGNSECLWITCGKIPEIPHAVIVNHLNKEILEFKDVTEYKCEDKYTLEGNASVVCQENGNYSSLPQCIGMPGPVMMTVFVCISVCLVILLVIYFFVKQFQKRKGSYDTGEGKRPKEPLMKENSFNYHQYQHKGP